MIVIIRLRDQVQELLTFFSGHDNEVIQMWDLQTAGVVFKKGHGKGQESLLNNKTITIVTLYTPFYLVGQKYSVHFRVAETLSRN